MTSRRGGGPDTGQAGAAGIAAGLTGVHRPVVSAIIVHYRTPALLEAAVAALHRDARASGFEMDVVVVDNGARSRGRAERPEVLDAKRREGRRRPGDGHSQARRSGRTRERDAGENTAGAMIIEPDSNLGYAGGINRGACEARGEVMLLMNADVVVQPGCLRALVDALADAEVAGPRLFWDRGCRLMLPPQQVRTRAAELDAAWAERSVVWGRSYRRRWRRRARAFWSAREPMPCFELTGALLAVRRDFWERVGPFDERYRLYFEETDWLLRVRALGARAVLAPAARAVHAYDQSAKREPRARIWFEQSMALFRRRRYGAWFAALLRLIERAPRRFADPPPLPPAGRTKPPAGGAEGPAFSTEMPAGCAEAPAGRTALRRPRTRPGGAPAERTDGSAAGETWIEATPLPLGVPAAGCRLDGVEPRDFELPEDVERGARTEVRVWASDGACRDAAPPLRW